MRSFLLLSSFVLTLAAGCAPSTTNDPGGSTEDQLQTKPASPADALNRLVTLLQAPEVLQMPPIAVAHSANALHVTVERVPVPATLRKIADAEITKVLARYGATTDVLALMDDPDTHVSVQAGFEEADIQKDLVSSLVAPAKRVEARAILKAMPSDYVRISINALGSEIIGDELILIRPVGETQAVVIHLEYSEN